MNCLKYQFLGGLVIDVLKFVKLLECCNGDFFAGVPDSQLKPLCNFLINTYGISNNHIIAANEGNARALTAGIICQQGKFPLVLLRCILKQL